MMQIKIFVLTCLKTFTAGVRVSVTNLIPSVHFLLSKIKFDLKQLKFWQKTKFIDCRETELFILRDYKCAGNLMKILHL